MTEKLREQILELARNEMGSIDEWHESSTKHWANFIDAVMNTLNPPEEKNIMVSQALEIEGLRKQLNLIREVLAGTDAGTLPIDLTTLSMANMRMKELTKFKNAVAKFQGELNH